MSLTVRRLVCLGSVVAIAWCGAALDAEVVEPLSAPAVELPFTPVKQTRRTVDGLMLPDSRSLIVANSKSGTLSVIDTDNEELVGEFAVGEGLSSIEDARPVHLLPTIEALLVTDKSLHQLIVCTFDGERLEVTDRINVPVAPVDVAVSLDWKYTAVACQWSRRVATFDLSVNHEEPLLQLKPLREIALPFEPGRIIPLPRPHHDRDFLVADAFGGEIAIVDAESGEVRMTPGIKGHNIADMTLSINGENLHVTHQFLNPLASTTHDDVLWGLLLENVVQTIPLSTLDADPTETEYLTGDIDRLGEVGRGAGDPAGIDLYVLPPDCRETRIVALSGVDEVIAQTTGNDVRIPVGDCPTQVLRGGFESDVYVINMLDDSISVIDMETLEVKTTISLGPRPPRTPAERGESLFRDAKLSLDGWLSCHSCHTDGHTNGLVADTTSDGSYQTPKAIPSLLGTRDANPWAWNGSFRELHQQVRQSVVSSMQGAALSASQERDIVAYLHTLRPPPPLMPLQAGDDADQVARGEQVFRSHGCATCHVPPLTYTSDAVYEVGMSDEAGLTKFNPPTLRGVSHRRRLLHDLRADSLEAVFTEHDHMSQGLSAEELADLVRFLRSL